MYILLTLRILDFRKQFGFLKMQWFFCFFFYIYPLFHLQFVFRVGHVFFQGRPGGTFSNKVGKSENGLIFCSFFGRIENNKKHFEINWPLADTLMPYKYSNQGGGQIKPTAFSPLDLKMFRRTSKGGGQFSRNISGKTAYADDIDDFDQSQGWQKSDCKFQKEFPNVQIHAYICQPISV